MSTSTHKINIKRIGFSPPKLPGTKDNFKQAISDGCGFNYLWEGLVMRFKIKTLIPNTQIDTEHITIRRQSITVPL